MLSSIKSSLIAILILCSFRVFAKTEKFIDCHFAGRSDIVAVVAAAISSGASHIQFAIVSYTGHVIAGPQIPFDQPLKIESHLHKACESSKRAFGSVVKIIELSPRDVLFSVENCMEKLMSEPLTVN